MTTIPKNDPKKPEYWWSKQMSKQNSLEQQQDENPNIKTAASQRHTKEEMEELEAALLDSPTWQHRKNSLVPEPFKDSCDFDINVIYGGKKKETGIKKNKTGMK